MEYDETALFSHSWNTELGIIMLTHYAYATAKRQLGQERAQLLFRDLADGKVSRSLVKEFRNWRILERYDRMPNASVTALARAIANERYKEPTEDDVERVRRQIYKLIEQREAAIRKGVWRGPTRDDPTRMGPGRVTIIRTPKKV